MKVAWEEVGRHEEVMDRIDGYLLLELLDWWKRWKELWIGCS